MEDEPATTIDHFDEFQGSLLFDRSVYRPMSTHMGYVGEPERATESWPVKKLVRLQ